MINKETTIDMNANNNIIDEVMVAVAGDNVSNLNLDPLLQIMVAGVGGAGGNAINHMQKMGIERVNFVACNTDKKALKNCNVPNKIQMGPGEGAGNDPNIGRELAIESEEQLRSLLTTSDTRMLFIAAGMGGGTGTGASPVIAKLAHDLDILTVAVVTMPLHLEGPTRYNQAIAGLEELKQWVDALLIIDNEKVMQMYGKLQLNEAFGKADEVLGMATKGIAELITVEEALVRVDFADVSRVMKNSGRTLMSVVTATGEDRAAQVAEKALTSALLDDNYIVGAKNILLNFSVSDLGQISHDDVTSAMASIQQSACYTDEDGNRHYADIIWGASKKPSLAEGELELVVVATGFADGYELSAHPVFNPVNIKPKGQTPTTSSTPVMPQVTPMPDDIPTITPSKSRYEQVKLQKLEPAFRRRKVNFAAESETQTRTVFRPAAREEVVEQQKSESETSLF